jgi:hypothetical protein
MTTIVRIRTQLEMISAQASNPACQCSDEHCHGLSHPSLFTGLLHPNEPDVQPPASMGGQGWPWAIPKVKIPLTSYLPSLPCSPPNTYACI